MIAVSRETAARLRHLEAALLAENSQQNLISASTIQAVWSRHIEDSLQLLPEIGAGVVLDIGSGAGFPGLVVACCRVDPVHLVEPRVRRAGFLARMIAELGLAHASIHQMTVQRLTLPPVDTITARAVAPLADLFSMAEHLSRPKTRWVLPKGRTASSDLEAARRLWQGEFRLKPSLTDPEAAIVLATGVRRRPPR